MFKRSKITLDMCDLFRNANGHLSYDTIQSHFGKTINELRPTILAARKYLERDESVVFENVRGEGYKRLDDSEKVDSLKTDPNTPNTPRPQTLSLIHISEPTRPY